ncbi:NRDE family protein [Robertkochia solimangrovi]|uniref:NRDE family protein n=1 Tax=Robertkochia solimangrovi TaxID=2213046 RepID=UPI00117FC41D|nr:NRDE family protein [Robertkochia solimangrovi]TRZ42796.1 hypothetical protein DMZ48_12055 [Robertkochia solimangrovi]
MCTVTYIPDAKGYTLTSNRDEDPSRMTLPPRHITVSTYKSIVAPVDKEKGGTWIATDNLGRTACLLNGAFMKHKRKSFYKRSRGSLIPEAYSYANFHEFMCCAILEGIEPFTLILIDELLQVLIWDGAKKYIQYLNTDRPHIWSSITLYDFKVQEHKQQIFRDFSEEHEAPTPDVILDLHGLKGSGEFVLDRQEVRTTSITQVVSRGLTSNIQYFEMNPVMHEQRQYDELKQ